MHVPHNIASLAERVYANIDALHLIKCYFILHKKILHKKDWIDVLITAKPFSKPSDSKFFSSTGGLLS